MKKMTKSEAGSLGAAKTWAKRMLIIEELRSFGGIQPNYGKWKTEHLIILLKAWKKQKTD